MTPAPKSNQEESLQRLFWRDFPLYKYMGLEIQSARDGIYRCFVPLRESNHNYMKTIHAGIQWSAAEAIGGVLVMTVFRGTPIFAVVKHVSMDFKRAARSGVTVEANFDSTQEEQLKAAFQRDGEAAFSLDITLRREDKTEVASAHADYLIRTPR
ncbi:DUF4442 domain-containing protein [Myxococcota bacterium]|nr:DUF4442 domain-containing protein [Myxococcota bacterium]